MSEIVRDTQAGLVVDPTPSAIAAGLRAMFGDPNLCRRQGEAGRTHVIEHYGWPAVARRMAELYRSIAGAAPPGAAA
jgi:glycosyltransferase involved in cell wall biosynthesis